jgi:effector-binding domain-containing protein
MIANASFRLTVAGIGCALLFSFSAPAWAQTAPAPAAPPTVPAPGVSPAAPPAASSDAQPATPQAPPISPPAATGPDGNAPNDASTGQTLELAAHPAAYIEGKANWDEGFAALTGSLGLIKGALTKAGIKPAGPPIAVFLETDDTGFRYRAMIPIDAIPEGKTSLTDAIKLGQTPAGKAMKFEHRGSYEDIDSTYEAITAYLDEKGLEAENLFIEEYLNEVKTPDDPTLEVDIFVLLK